MKTFKLLAYKIQCLTNLHVGSGGDNFGVIDKEVQRDQIDGTPIIHASSLKGAFREFLEEEIYKKNQDDIIHFFGSDKDENEKHKQGALRFFEAQLLAIPVRGIGNKSNYISTATCIIEKYNSFIDSFQNEIRKIEIPTSTNSNAATEFGNATLLNSIGNIGNNIVLFNEETMNEVLKSLPIIARNSLENGNSENLWYEEAIPRNTIFYFFVAVPESDLQTYLDKIEKHLLENTIQIGANATIGYGFCKISKI